MAFFAPLLGGRSFSTVAGLQSVVYPWAAAPAVAGNAPQADQAQLSYPFYAFVQATFARGDFPLWNPLSFWGRPFWSNGASAVLYPLRAWMNPWLDPGRAHDLFSFLHVWLAGLFAYGLFRALAATRPAALFGALAWMLNPFLMAWLHLEVVAPVGPLLPLVLWAVHAAVLGRGTRPLGLAALALALPWYSGQFAFMALVAGCGLLFGLYLSLLRAPGTDLAGPVLPRPARLARLAVVSVLSLLLAAAVLLPTIQTARDTRRQPHSLQEMRELEFAVSPRTLLHLVRPPEEVSAPAMHEQTYVGIIPLALALVGCVRRRRGRAFALALVVGVLVATVDSPLYAGLYTAFPQYGFLRPLGRYLVVSNLGLVLLAVFGLDRLRLAGRSPRAAAARLPLAWRALVPGRHVAIAAALALVTALDLLAHARHVTGTFPPREAALLFPATPLLEATRSEVLGRAPGPGRIAPVSASMPPGSWRSPMLYGATHLVHGLPSASGYDSLVPRWSGALAGLLAGELRLDQVGTPVVGAVGPVFRANRVRWELLGRTGVTHLVASPDLDRDPSRIETPSGLPFAELRHSGPDGRLYALRESFPDPYWACRLAVVADEREAIVAFLGPSFAPGEDLLVEARQLARLEGTSSPEAHCAQPPPWNVRRETNGLEMALHPGPGGWLVIPESWDAGWRAEADGNPLPVLRANGVFRAVPVPAGAKTLRLSYFPALMPAGLGASGLGLVLVLALLAGLPRERPAPDLSGRTP